MRIANSIMYDRMTRGFQENLRKLIDVQEKLASGKKINKPSDDLIGISKILDYKLSINKNDQYLRSIDDAESFLEYTDSIMSSVSNSLIRVRELALTAANETESAEKCRDQCFVSNC